MTKIPHILLAFSTKFIFNKLKITANFSCIKLITYVLRIYDPLMAPGDALHKRGKAPDDAESSLVDDSTVRSRGYTYEGQEGTTSNPAESTIMDFQDDDMLGFHIRQAGGRQSRAMTVEDEERYLNDEDGSDVGSNASSVNDGAFSMLIQQLDIANPDGADGRMQDESEIDQHRNSSLINQKIHADKMEPRKHFLQG